MVETLAGVGWLLVFALAFMTGGVVLSGFASVVEWAVERRLRRVRGRR